MPRGLSPNQCNEIEAKGIIPDECKFMNPTLHICRNGWDGYLIDDSDPEIEQCKCKNGGRDAATNG